MDAPDVAEGLTVALRELLTRLQLLLEAEGPSTGADQPLVAAVESWRRALAAARAPSLELRARLGLVERECSELRTRNAELLDEVVRLNTRNGFSRRELVEAQLARDQQRAEARRLDLEVRDLRRRVRELEGGPPLSPSEAAPRSKDRARPAPRRARPSPTRTGGERPARRPQRRPGPKAGRRARGSSKS